MAAKESCHSGIVLLFAVCLGSTSAEQPCRLGGKPDAGVLQIKQKANISLECDASCLGPLSRGQVTWTDPGGAIVSLLPGRVFTVNYNRWMTSRLILLDAQTEDSGVYRCEVNHNGLHLQRFTVIRVEETPATTRDPGPRRGDISVAGDPHFPEVRAVRDVSSKTEGEKVSGAVEGERTKTGPESISRTTKGESMNDQDPNLVSADTDSFVGDFDPDGIEDNDSQDSDDLTTDTASWDEPLSGRRRMRRSNDGRSSDASVGSGEGQPTQSATTMTQETTTSENTSQTTAGSSSVQADGAYSGNPAINPAPSHTSTVTGTTSTVSESTVFSTSSSGATAASNRNSSPADTVDGAGHRAQGTPTSASLPNAGAGANMETSGKSSEGCESTFGRHGLLAFAVTLAVAVLLLYALLLVILVPRCCGRRKRETPSRGEENVALVDKKHKKLEPMTSATGLNGEFITAVDLDAPDQNDEAKKPKDENSDKKEEKSGKPEGESSDKKKEENDKPKDESSDKKEEESEKSAESFVSTFLLGRLSSSKPDEGANMKAVAAGEDDVFAGTSGKGNDVTPTSSSGEKTGDPEKSTTPPAEEKTEIKFENELSDAGKKEAAKDEGGEKQPAVQSPDEACVNGNERIQDIPLVV